MRAKILVSAVAMLVAFAGCVGAAADPEAAPDGPTLQPPSGDESAIVGTVTDDQMQPLADVEVAVLGVDPPIATVSDQAGAFVLNNVPPGTHKLAAQRLGYTAAARNVELAPGQTLELNLVLTPISVGGPARQITLIGEGYFACGAYLIVTTWGNLHGCVWDNHKPNFTFHAAKQDIRGILLEVTWKRNSGITSELLAVSLKYKQVCNPFCSQEQQWGSVQGPNPVRSYIDFDKQTSKVKEDPMPLSSVTFPGGRGPSGTNPGSGPVVVFQQRMTHYVTLFYGEHCTPAGEECPLEIFTAIPDA